MALDGALRVLNPSTKELKYLLELLHKDQIGGMAFECALRTFSMKELVYLLQLHEENIIADEGLYSGLRALRSPIETMDVQKPSNT